MKLKQNSKKYDINKSELSSELFKELFNPTINLSIDYSELYIDDIVNNETIKEIPLVKSIVGIIKVGISINQFWFVKKLLTFIRDFNNNTIEKNKLESFKKKLDNNPSLKKKIAEKLLIYIDRNIEITQTKIISNLFTSYVNEDISYDQMNSIIITLDNLNPRAFDCFFNLEKVNFEINEENKDIIQDRNWELESLITNSGFALEQSMWFHSFKMTDDGLKLFEYGIKPLRESK